MFAGNCWPYTPKANTGSPGSFPQGTFFEGGIDLTALGLTDTCFSTFMAETRSSAPFDSTLKDFVGPSNFDTCSIEVTKACNNPRLNGAGDKIVYDISGKVTASGFGSNVYDVALRDSPAADDELFEWVDCDDHSNKGWFPLNTLNGSACYKNTISVALVDNGVKDTVTATANTQDNGAGVALSDSADATCPKLTVAPKISVTKNCVASVEAKNDNVVAKVTVWGTVCNVGDSDLSNVAVVDRAIPTTPDPLVSGGTLNTPNNPANPTVSEGACIEFTGSYYPSVANDFDGKTTTCPGAVVFKDTVEATATDIFNQDVFPDNDPADCKLCDGTACSPSSP